MAHPTIVYITDCELHLNQTGNCAEIVCFPQHSIFFPHHLGNLAVAHFTLNLLDFAM